VTVKQPTHGERLARIEVLLETNAATVQSVATELRSLSVKVDALRIDLDHHKNEYYALKNKGIGAAAVLSIMFAGLGFIANKAWDKIVGVFA